SAQNSAARARHPPTAGVAYSQSLAARRNRTHLRIRSPPESQLPRIEYRPMLRTRKSLLRTARALAAPILVSIGRAVPRDAPAKLQSRRAAGHRPPLSC